jgi:urea transporter
MMDMCELHNCYDGLHPKCLASVSTSERWKCIFGMVWFRIVTGVIGVRLMCVHQNILEHVNVPLLVTSSLLDTWQLLMAYKWPWYSVDTNGAQIITQVCDLCRGSPRFGYNVLMARSSNMHPHCTRGWRNG